MRISVIVTYLTHDPMIKVQVLCPHTGKLGDDRDFFSRMKRYSRESARHFLTLMTLSIPGYT